MMARLLIAVLVALLVAGCASSPMPHGGGGDALSAQVVRESVLASESAWSLVGRVAVRNQGQGGSGHIEWRQRGDDFEITLAAPISRQGWRLVREGTKARLEGLEGGVRHGPDAEALLLEATGWSLPIAAMIDWVRGGRHSLAAQIEFGPDGLPASMAEHGWRIEYREWDGGVPVRPRRMFAEQARASVRLVIERWSVP